MTFARFHALLALAAALLLAQTVTVYTVKEDHHPLRAGCAEADEEVARLRKGDPVKIRYALAAGEQPCYAVTVETDGKTARGFLHADALAGVAEFDKARREALAASAGRLPPITRGAQTPVPASPPVPHPRAAPLAAGQPVPAFSLAALDQPGHSYGNHSLLGKTYLIDFWATWCGPCLAEMPHLHQSHEKYKSRNFEILSVSFDRKPADAAKFRQDRWKMPWLHAYAPGGFANETARRFQVTGIPSAVLVDPQGRVLARGGALRGANLDRTLARALGGE